MKQTAKRWIAGLRTLARRVSAAMRGSGAGREAFLLACLFVVVGVLGGVRIGEEWGVPSLSTLVLAVGMIVALHRCGALTLDRFVKSSGSPFDFGGLFVVLAVGFASAQAFELTIPESSVLRWVALGLYVMVIVALVTRTIPADRGRFLWVFGTIVLLAFTFKFVVLPSTETGGLREILCEIVTLGMCEAQHPATGYLAFATLVLYLLLLGRLPAPSSPTQRRPPTTTSRGTARR